MTTDQPYEQGEPSPRQETREPASDEGERPPSPPEEHDEFDEGLLDQNATVINNFFADVDAGGATFGAGGRRSSRAAVGRLPATDVAASLRGFVEPPAWARAVAVLREQHVLVLCGREESGRWTGAVAALDAMGLDGDGIWMYSPSTSLAELNAGQRFQARHGYLLHDWIEATGDVSVRRFELETLARKVAEAGAYLVITVRAMKGRRPFDKVQVDWEPPNPGALFDARLAGVAPPEHEWDALARLRLHAEKLVAPGPVTTLAERVAQGTETPSRILADVEDEVVAGWFGREDLKRADVLAVCAVAFAHGAPERVFEQLLADLVATWDQFGTDKGLDVRRQDDERLPQTRALWSGGHPLINVVVDTDAGFGGERRVVFRGEHYRAQVIAALARHYGYELWQPLRQWIRGLADADIEVQFQAAVGVALLVRADPAEVKESFLDEWAAGRMFERLAAANVLALLSMEDDFAPIALDLALSWVRDAGQERAMTAAIAFGNGIWIRYPTDALKWLWFLALRGVRVSVVARRSLMLLFRQAAEHGEAVAALTLLAQLAGEEVDGAVGTRRTRTALAAVTDILTATCLSDPGVPLPTQLLSTHPESAAPLGVLWAGCLASNHHRVAAVRALKISLTALRGRAETIAAVAALGAAVWRTLPPEWHPIVERDLRRALSGPDDGTAALPARDLVNALLAAGVRRSA
ncbi:hypothetical protein ACTMTF_40980 [Nonomuraea sp. ZG12]|uniref:hypothetical protein n=1 Tax=Nonomuraea sp. ZG12 TaxID=3452207 RepID=UPI003F8A6D34